MHQGYSSVEPSHISKGRSAFLAARILITLFLGLFAHTLWAQVSGEFLGVVTDPSGSAVAAAKVTLQNVETGLVRQTSTDATGNYEFLAVPVGDGYNVAVEAPGFEKNCAVGFQALGESTFSCRLQFTRRTSDGKCERDRLAGAGGIQQHPVG